MQQPSNIQPLAEALAAFRTTRPSYQSTSDQALSQLLISLAEHALAPPGQLATAPPEQQKSPEIAALQARLDALQAAYEAQRAELARLRAPVPSRRVAAPLHSEVVSPPRDVRPIDYWEQHIPDYGDTTTAADMAAYHAKQRVRPEDVVLTTEEQARLERRRPPQQSEQPWAITLVWIIAFLLVLYVLNGIFDLRGMIESLR
jgi:hypothetical protein